MNYIGSNIAINWLFILALLSVLQWILTTIFVYKKFSILGSKITNKVFSSVILYKEKNRISFVHDYFYIYWNIYPIIFYAFFYYLDTSWHTYLLQIYMIGGGEAEKLYSSFFPKDSIKWYDIIALSIITIFAYLATFMTQIKKQKQYIQSKDKLYWWDIRISKELYWIRFIFLFFNMILVGFIAYLGFKVVLFVSAVLSLHTLTINPFHPDCYGGLKVLMEIASVILAIYLLRAVLGIVGLYDHKGVKDKLQKFGDIYHLSYLFFGIGFIGFFIFKMKQILDSVDISALLSPVVYRNFTLYDESNVTSVITNVSNMSTYYDKLLHFNKFPIDLNLFFSSIFTFVLPLVIWFLVNTLQRHYHE